MRVYFGGKRWIGKMKVISKIYQAVRDWLSPFSNEIITAKLHIAKQSKDFERAQKALAPYID